MASKKRFSYNKGAEKPKDRIKQLENLEKRHEEWKCDYTIDFCFTAFMISRMERQASKETLRNYRSFYKKYVVYLAEIHMTTPKEMTIELLETKPESVIIIDYFNKLPITNGSKETYLRHYRAFGNWCVEEGYITDFECKVKNTPTTAKEVYTIQELNKLLVKPPVSSFWEFRTYCMISLMLNTGARRTTLINIRICDVELDEGYINFNVTKTGKIVRLGLEKKTKRDLTEFIKLWRIDKGAEPTDYLFCNEYGEKLNPGTVNQSIIKYNRSRGVEKTSVHLFRHTFAKMWITSGGDIISLARVLTHSELDMVKRYANLYGSDIKKEIEEHSVMSQLKTRSGKTLKNR